MYHSRSKGRKRLTKEEFIETLKKITKDIDDYMDANENRIDALVEKLKEKEEKKDESK